MTRELPFTLEEYQTRVDKVRVKMAQRNLATLLLVNPVSTNYLTGYQTIAVSGYQCLILPLGGKPTMLVWELELPGVFLSSRIEDGVSYRTGEDQFEVTRQLLHQRGLLGGTVGIERDGHFLSAQDYERLIGALGRCKLADGSGIIRELLREKSPQEIAYIKEAGKISAKGMHAAIDAASAGATDNQVAAAACQALIEAGSEYMCVAPIVTTGTRSGIPHTTHQRNRIEQGDPVWIETGACCHRYSAPLMRTVFVGQPSDGAERLADASMAALEKVMSTITPGITADEIATEGAKALPLDDPSVVFHHTYGYSIGLGFPPTWADDSSLTLVKGNKTTLEPGMVFHATMGLRREGKYGAVVSETIAVTENGCEALTDFPREFFYK